MQRWQLLCSSTVTVSFIATTFFTNWFQVSYNTTPMELFFNSSNVGRGNDLVPRYKKNNTSKSVSSKPPQSNTYVCSNPMGRLGNLMFQYAAMYAIAKRNGKKPIYFQKGLELFPNRSVKNGRCSGKYISIHENGALKFNENFFNLPKNQNVVMCCYFYSWKYIRHCEDDIRREFTLSNELRMETQKFLSDIAASVSKANKHIPHHNTSSITFVGVHVRRGDKIGLQYTGELVPPRTYLEKAMSYYRSKYKNVHFVVCSDGLVWCKQNLNFTDVTFCNGRSRDSDFATLVNCNHTIMTIGSFGWWAGFLAGGDVVYYSNVLPNTFISKEMNKNDVYKPNWIQIEL